MKKKLFLLTIFSMMLNNLCFSEEIVNGYYITKSNDTIMTKIVIDGLFDLHNVLIVIDSTGNKHSFKPTDIKGFSFIFNKDIDDSKPFSELNHKTDSIIRKIGFQYQKKTFNIDSELHSSYYLTDSIWNFESCNIDADLNLFLRVKYGNGGSIHADHYYSKFDEYSFYHTEIWILVKDNKIVAYDGANVKDWLISCISDYPLLTTIVKEDKIKAFPFDFNFVIDDYNNWIRTPVGERPDTSLMIKGILDANKFYHPIKPFVLSCVGGIAFFLPGLASAVINAHNPKEKNIKIPEKLSNRDNIEYSKAFRHRAYEKKYKASGRGAITGGSIFMIILIALVL